MTILSLVKFLKSDKKSGNKKQKTRLKRQKRLTKSAGLKKRSKKSTCFWLVIVPLMEVFVSLHTLVSACEEKQRLCCRSDTYLQALCDRFCVWFRSDAFSRWIDHSCVAQLCVNFSFVLFSLRERRSAVLRWWASTKTRPPSAITVVSHRTKRPLAASLQFLLLTFLPQFSEENSLKTDL